MIPSWSSSRSESLDTTVGGFFLGFLAGGFGSVLRCREGCCSSSDSESVLCSAFRAALFLAVGGPTRGVLPLFLRCCSASSSSSSKVVGRCLAAVRRSNVRDLRSPNGRAYNRVGCSSPASSVSGLNGRACLLSCLGRFLAGLFPDGGGGLAKSGRVVRRLLGVVDDPDVPGVQSSSS